MTTTHTRRAALAAIATAPVISSMGVASATASPIVVDPVFAARDAWREAERVMDAACDRFDAMEKPPMPKERLATVLDRTEPGGLREVYAYDLLALTPAAEKEGAFIGRDFAGRMPEAERLEKYERLRVARAKRDKAVAALEAEAGLTDAREASRKALRDFLNTEATTPAGVAAKLREIDTDHTDEPVVEAAILDLDRLEREGLQIASGAPHSAMEATPVSDPAVAAYHRAMAASEAYNDASRAIEAVHEVNSPEYDPAFEAMESGPVGREHTEAWGAALAVSATTLQGLALKARIAANAQGIPTDRRPDRAPDAVMYTLIQDIERMAGQGVA